MTTVPPNGDKESVFFEDLGIEMTRFDSFDFVEDSSIDLVLTDPPFNIARKTNFHTYEKNTINSFQFDEGKGWDSKTPDQFKDDLHRWARGFSRVLKPSGTFAVFCADEYVSHLISSLRDAGLRPKRTVTWRKPNAVPVNRKYLMMSACEFIVVGSKGPKATFNSDISTIETDRYQPSEVVNLSDKVSAIIEIELRRMLESQKMRLSPSDLQTEISALIQNVLPSAVSRATKIYDQEGNQAELCVPNYVSFNSKTGNRLHPTEKPVPLLRYLISLLSNDGDTVLDPFSGSGSTAEACLLSGRKARCVEMDPEYFAKSIARITGVSHQIRQLFS